MSVQKHFKFSKKDTKSVTIITGISPKLEDVTRLLYLHLSKMYYAKRHGYNFLLLMSAQFVHYFPSNLYEVSSFK